MNITESSGPVIMAPETTAPATIRQAFLRRRAVLTLVAAALASATGSKWRPAESVIDALHRLLGNSASLRDFGCMVRVREADAALRLLARLDGLEADAVGQRIDALRQADFAAGRVVIIDGWVLARTEAEACALIAVS